MKTVVRNKMICGGAPTLEGTRLAVFDVVTRIALDGHETTIRDMTLSIDEIRSCLRYCANLFCVLDGGGLPFCNGCRLARTPPAQIAAIADEFVATGDPGMIGLTVTDQEYESDLSLTWLIASEQISKLPTPPNSPSSPPQDR